MWNIIESYIQKNRPALDVDQPGDHLWEGIAMKLEERSGPSLKRKSTQWQIWKMAAAIAISIGIGYVLSHSYSAINPNGVPGNSVLSSLIGTSACEAHDKKMAEFEKLEKKSQKVVAQLHLLDPTDFPQVKQFLLKADSLEADYQALRREARINGCKSDLIRKLEQNTKTKALLIDELVL
ncbi:MAG: hypothetical protein AAF206_17975, partial [Bacteroidota bacterium]